MAGANNYGPNLQRLWDKEAIVAGTYQKRVKVAGLSDVALQWVQFAAAGAATITIYSTTLWDTERDLEDLDPSTNPVWRDETPNGANFLTEPTPVIGTDMITLEDNPFTYLLIELVVGTDLTEFTFIVRGQGRSG